MGISCSGTPGGTRVHPLLRIKDLTSLRTGQCNMPPAYCDYEFESLGQKAK